MPGKGEPTLPAIEDPAKKLRVRNSNDYLASRHTRRLRFRLPNLRGSSPILLNM